MRDDELALLQELVSYANSFAEQAARIAAQVEDQSLQISEGIQSLGDLMLGGLVEAIHVHVADAGFDQEMHINAIARNLIAHQRKLHRFLHAFTRDADVNRGSLGPLE